MRSILTVVLGLTSLAPSTRTSWNQQGSAVSAVERIYRDEAWQASDRPARGIDVFNASADTMAGYLDSALVAAVMADRRCQQRVEGVCNLDFSPVWASQDPSGQA